MSDQPRRPEAAKSKPPMPKPQIVQRGAFLVAGLRYEGWSEHGEIPALWDQFLPRIGELASIRVGHEAYGAIRAMPGVPAEQGFEYLASVEVKSLADLPPGMVGWEIPAQTYAVLPAHGVPDLGRANDDLFVRWLPQSKFESADGPMFELYPATWAQDLIIYVYASVRPK